jgi:signal transduction histidine kinase/ligand-binding sensor domain-containing protein
MRVLLAIATLAVPWPAVSDADDGIDGMPWADRTAPVFQLIASQSGSEAGLPYTASPVVLAQDEAGFIWIGTESGLERWDGYRIREYTALAGDECGLRGGAVWTLYTDERKRLWIGTRGGGVARYDPQTDCIRAVGNGADALNGVTVEGMAGDGAGGLWIGSTTGLLHLSADLVHVSRVGAEISGAEPLGHERVIALLRDRAGMLWVGTEKGLGRLDPGQARFDAFPLPASTEVTAVFQSSDGRIWVGTVASGAFVIDPLTLQSRAVLEIQQREPIPEIDAFSETPAGEVWLATPRAGIIAVDSQSLHTRTLHHQKGVGASLPEDYASDLLRDRNGVMWVALKTGFGFFNSRPGVSTILLADDLNGLPEGAVRTMARMSDDRIALRAGDRIALIGPTGTGHEIVRLGLRKPAQSLGTLATPNGRDLFATTVPDGLVWIEPAAARSYPLPTPGTDPPQNVDDLFADGDRLWAGGLHSLWLYERRTDGRASPVPWQLVRRFEVRDTIAIAAGMGDTRWVGTAKGLYRVDGESPTPTHVQLISESGAPLQDQYVTSLHSDRRGHLWVGASNQGLFQLDPSAGPADRLRVQRHFLADLPGGPVTQLLEDRRGDIWVATDRGIAHIDADSFAVRRLLRGDGIAISGYATGACTVLSDGNLLFGGRDGITLIDPDRIRQAAEPPPIVITRIAVGDREIRSAHFNSDSGVAVLDVPSGARSVAVEFSALDYSDPAHNGYAYRLDGYDRDWVSTGFDLRMAMYTNLPPGTYRLRLRGTDHAGLWSPHERQLIVHVAAAWYQTMWFRALELIGLLLAMYTVVQARTVLLRARQRELESLVDVRTTALVRATEERATLIENLAHDLRTPLTSLRGYLETLSIEHASLSEPDRGRFVGIAVRQVERLNRLVRELFDLVRLDDARARLTLERFSPAELLQDVVQEFRAISEGRSIVFQPEQGAERAQMVGDINLIQRMIENLVDNAVNHTAQGGMIAVKLALSDGQIILEVRDTGRGIKPADLGRIFERYERGDTSDRIAGTGLGLAIVKRIVELHSGSIAVDSQLGVGTYFTVRLPVAGPASSD